jgi:MHS family proline/betaine transporter-like MFS transporter
MTGYIVTIGKIPQRSALWIGTFCLAVFVVLIPFMGALSDRIGRKPLLMASCVGYALLGYPLFVMASSGDITMAFIAQLVMVVMLAPFAGACPAAYSELFPTRVRYTALSIGYNTAVAIFGGFAPFIATFLIRETGNNLAPSFYVIAAAVITLIVLTRVKETAFSPLK